MAAHDTLLAYAPHARATLPRDPSFDATAGFLADPYGYVSKRARALGTDAFETRFLLRDAVCLTGPEAARLFYDPQRFVRAGAAPEPLRATLFGRGGVQTLDGLAHRERKRMFMSLMTEERIRHLGALAAAEWQQAARGWARRGRIVLYDELHVLLTNAVCRWAGVPLTPRGVRPLARDLARLFDDTGALGAGHFRARRARARSERWAAALVERVRAGHLAPPRQSALFAVATHRDVDGRLLAPRVAAVELLNVLRPTVAVSVYVVFLAHALLAHPASRRRIQAGDEQYAAWFVQEVRRYYPFFPAALARVRDDFEWRGFRFRKGMLAVLDLHGTNRDPRTYVEPDEFRPERFAGWTPSPWNLVPQGGGDHLAGHRCPGEWITLELMGVSLDFLARRLHFAVPRQDLSVDLRRLPALPRSRLVLEVTAPGAKAGQNPGHAHPG